MVFVLVSGGVFSCRFGICCCCVAFWHLTSVVFGVQMVYSRDD